MFKTGQYIYCENDEGFKKLMEILEQKGYKWSSGGLPTKYGPPEPVLKKYVVIHLMEDKKLGWITLASAKRFHCKITNLLDLLK